MNQQQKNELPETIKINWRTYKIIEKDTVSGGDNYLGFVNNNEGFIELKKDDQDSAGKRVSFLHEVVHSILYYAGNKLKRDENFIEMMANGIYQILKENPEVVKWIINK